MYVYKGRCYVCVVYVVGIMDIRGVCVCCVIQCVFVFVQGVYVESWCYVFIFIMCVCVIGIMFGYDVLYVRECVGIYVISGMCVRVYDMYVYKI